MSTIKLPPLPKGVSPDQGIGKAMREYAEEAVRQALAEQVPVAACLPGYGCTIVSTDLDHLGRNGWRGLALIPENSDG